MPNLLTAASVMMCPHGGTVIATPNQVAAGAGGAPLLRASDTFIVAGCPFLIVLVPHPCVQVKWVQAALQGKAGGDFLLNEASVGLCVGPDQAVQGPVTILSTQPLVSGR